MGLYAHMLRNEVDVHVPGGPARALDQASAHHGLAPRPAAARAQGRPDRGAQPARLQHVPRLVRAALRIRGDPRRSPSRQLHGAAGPEHQPARLRLHPGVPAEPGAGRDRSLSGARARRPGAGGACLRDLGLRGSAQGGDRDPQPLGRVPVRAAARRPAAPDRGDQFRQPRDVGWCSTCSGGCARSAA